MKIIPLILASLLLLIVVPLRVQSTEPIIIGDLEYIDDSSIYLSAQPHTLGSSGWVTLQLKVKTASLNIDCAFGYQVGNVRPTKLQLWTSYYHPKLVLISQNVSIMKNENGTTTWSNYTTGNWTWTNETYEDWKDVNINPDVYYFNFSGANRWYIFENIPITQNVLYKVRVYLELPFAGLNRISGEYSFAIKPHSETIQQSIANNHFYVLDPWWDSNWNNRVWVEINQGYIRSILSGFPILVHLPTDITNKTFGYCDDIRFVATDNATLYHYEIESIDWSNASRTAIWVNISTIQSAGTPTCFWIYYNNSLASPAAVSDDTVWNNYIGVWHMNDSYVIWDSTSYRHSKAGGVANGVNVSYSLPSIGNGTYFTGSHGYSLGDVNDVGLHPFTLETAFNATTIGAATRMVVSKYEGAPGYFISTSTASNRYIWSDIYVSGGYPELLCQSGNQPFVNDVHMMMVTQTLLATKATSTLVFDCGRLTSVSSPGGTEGDTNNTHFFKIGYWDTGDDFNGVLTEIRLTLFERNDSWINATQFSMNRSDFLNFSIPENFTGGEYIIVTCGYMFNQTTNVCPCCVTLGLNVTTSMGSNVTVGFYLTTSPTAIVNFTVQYSNATFYCEVGDLQYNRTYRWYGRVNTTQTTFNYTDVFVFNTTTYVCSGGGGGGTTTYNNYTNVSFNNYTNVTYSNATVNATTVQSVDNSGIIGIVGVIGLFGFILGWRRRRRI